MKTFRQQIEVRWADMDALGHVNNARYFRYMEQARIAWMAQLDSEVMRGEEGPIIVAANCQFLRPIVYPATIEVSCEVSELGRSSFPIRHVITLAGNPGEKFAEGEVILVWVNYKQGKSVPLPDWLRAAFA
jgi:acyl-CoA thioester hydrolase